LRFSQALGSLVLFACLAPAQVDVAVFPSREKFRAQAPICVESVVSLTLTRLFTASVAPGFPAVISGVGFRMSTFL